MRLFLRNLILGPGKFIEDYSLYMRAKLLGYLALLSIGIASFYFFMNLLYYNRTEGNLQFITVVIVSCVTLYLARLGHFTAATLVQFAVANGIVFYFAYYDDQDTNYLYYLSIALGGLALLGYHKRWLSFFAVVFTFGLFVISYTGAFGFSEHPFRTHPLYNFIFVSTACVLILQYTMRLHHHSEKLTREKNIQLQKVNAELDRFVYSASHDLRAPLSSVLGLIELARKTGDKEEIENYLLMMKGRIHHLDEFIREIIDYSRNERMEVVRQPVNLHQLIEDISLDLMHLEGAGSIDLINEVPSDMIWQSDAMRLKIVLNNLLNNAIKYHDQNKESRYIRVSAAPSTHGVDFAVSDNGMGISAEHHDKVFNMFYRASDKSKGSGLGLYIVKESLGQLGGSVSVKSELGEGTTFTVQLPA